MIIIIIFIIFYIIGILPIFLQNITSFFIHFIKSSGSTQPKKRTFNFDRITSNIYLGTQPQSIDDIHKLTKLGINNILSINYNWELHIPGDSIIYDNINRWQIQTPDFQSLTLDDLYKSCRIIDDVIKQNKCIYIHCNAGKGRSAQVVVCYLLGKMYKYRYTIDDIFKYVKKKRPSICNSINSIIRAKGLKIRIYKYLYLDL